MQHQRYELRRHQDVLVRLFRHPLRRDLNYNIIITNFNSFDRSISNFPKIIYLAKLYCYLVSQSIKIFISKIFFYANCASFLD